MEPSSSTAPSQTEDIAIGKLRGEDYNFEFKGKVKDGKMHFRLFMTQVSSGLTGRAGGCWSKGAAALPSGWGVEQHFRAAGEQQNPPSSSGMQSCCAKLQFA